MELGGDNLAKIMSRLKSTRRSQDHVMDMAIIGDIWRQMLSIVGTLHANSIVHMDLKPDNLIFFGSTLKIVDLGISRKVDAVG
jgi:serine/threonine protein kinase